MCLCCCSCDAVFCIYTFRRFHFHSLLIREIHSFFYHLFWLCVLILLCTLDETGLVSYRYPSFIVDSMHFFPMWTSFGGKCVCRISYITIKLLNIIPCVLLIPSYNNALLCQGVLHFVVTYMVSDMLDRYYVCKLFMKLKSIPVVIMPRTRPQKIVC